MDGLFPSPSTSHILPVNGPSATEKGVCCLLTFSLLLTSFPSSASVCASQPLCEPMDCGPPGSYVHEISQERTLEWVPISSSTVMGLAIGLALANGISADMLQAKAFNGLAQLHLALSTLVTGHKKSLTEYLLCPQPEPQNGQTKSSPEHNFQLANP